MYLSQLRRLVDKGHIKGLSYDCGLFRLHPEVLDGTPDGSIRAVTADQQEMHMPS